MQLDRFDARILAELQRDGRLPVVALAETIGLSRDPVRAPNQGSGVRGRH